MKKSGSKVGIVSSSTRTEERQLFQFSQKKLWGLASWQASFVMSSSLDLNGKTFDDELNGFSAVSLSRRHEQDAAVTVLVVVPVHESRNPKACFVLAAEGRRGVSGRYLTVRNNDSE